jgi:antitoxin component HigA of HigAB toxin-antitoxin module
VLTLLIEDYEEKRYPVPSVSPNESLKALMDDRGIEAEGHLADTRQQRRGHRNPEWPAVDQ